MVLEVVHTTLEMVAGEVHPHSVTTYLLVVDLVRTKHTNTVVDWVDSDQVETSTYMVEVASDT